MAVTLISASWGVGAHSASADDRGGVAARGGESCPDAGQPPTRANAYSDIDGDHITDPVVGEPGRSTSGGIVVYGSRAGDPPRFLPGSAFAGLDASPTFGTAIARIDADRDGCADLIVSDPGHRGGAAVDVLWGSPTGVQTAGATQLLEHTGRADEFGAAVAASPYAPENCTGQDCAPITDVWVGAPGRTVDGLRDEGAIEVFDVSTDRTAHWDHTIDENEAGGPDQPAAGDRLGGVLAGYRDPSFSSYGAVLVGLPNATVDGKAQAGVVLTVSVLEGGTYWYTQNSPGVPGVAEAGDHFGAALSAQDAAVFAVGVPGEDIGSVKDAGLVETFGPTPNGVNPDVPTGAFSQNSPGVPGVAEAGDHFGAAVAVGVQSGVPTCAGDPEPTSVIAVGVPGEDNSGHANSGTVAIQTKVRVSLPGGHCTYRNSYQALTQGRQGALGGANEPGDRVGASVDVTAGGDTVGVVVVGVPGEDLDGVVDAGVAEVIPVRNGGARFLGNLAGRQAGCHFGAVLVNEGV